MGGVEAGFKAILNNLPAEASPRAPWPTGDPRKQTAIENACFEDGATVHFEKLVPLQSWAPMVGMAMPYRTSFIVTNTVRIALEANLKLRQPEIDAISETCAKNYNRGSWSPPTAIAIAAVSAYHGKDNFRFPFWTPTASWFSPHSFPTQRWALLKGTPANYAWHFCRFMAYYPITRFAAALFYSSIIRMSITSDVVSDPRLSRVNEVFRQKALSNRRPVPQRASLPQPREQETDDQSIGQSDSERRDESYRRVGLTPPSTEELRQMADQRRTPGNSSTEQQEARTPLESSSSWADSELFGEDDGSPVSAAARRAERERAAVQTRVQGLGGSGASSWDRVRQQAKSDASAFAKGDRSGQETTWSQVQQGYTTAAKDGNRTPASESYSYSESDEAKNYAKNQAQNEFDALLEAERKGEGENGKWK